MNNDYLNKFPLLIEVITLLLLFIFFNITGGLIIMLLESWVGFQVRTLDQSALIVQRDVLRIQIAISNSFTFLLPGVCFSFLLYKKKGLDCVQAHKVPRIQDILLGLFITISSLYMIAYSLELNSKIPLADWMIDSGNNQNIFIKAMLTMENIGELVATLVVVALIPAVGEEWIFRGILQHRLAQKIFNPHLAIWIIAIIFSLMHFQFEGFIPRVLLGAILGYIYLWTKNLWVPIIVHFFHNGSQVVNYYIYASLGEEVNIEHIPIVSFWQGFISLTLTISLLLVLRFIHNKSSLST